VQHSAVEAAHERADLHPGRQWSWPEQAAQHRPDRRWVARRRREIAARFGSRSMRMAGQGRQTGLDVVGVAVAERAQDGQSMRDPSRTRQQLTEANAGNAGGDGPEFAALGRRSVGLGIPRLLLGMSAVEIEDDDRTRSAERTTAGRRRAARCAESGRQGESDSGDVEQFSPAPQKGTRRVAQQILLDGCGHGNALRVGYGFHFLVTEIRSVRQHERRISGHPHHRRAFLESE